MRLHDFLRNQNGDGISAAQYRALKKRFPLVVTNHDGYPEFKDKPKTREQALNWIRNKRMVEDYEETHDVQGIPKTLILIKEGVQNFSIEDYLMQRFSIEPGEL